MFLTIMERGIAPSIKGQTSEAERFGRGLHDSRSLTIAMAVTLLGTIAHYG